MPTTAQRPRGTTRPIASRPDRNIPSPRESSDAQLLDWLPGTSEARDYLIQYLRHKATWPAFRRFLRNPQLERRLARLKRHADVITTIIATIRKSRSKHWSVRHFQAKPPSVRDVAIDFDWFMRHDKSALGQRLYRLSPDRYRLRSTLRSRISDKAFSPREKRLWSMVRESRIPDLIPWLEPDHHVQTVLAAIAACHAGLPKKDLTPEETRLARELETSGLFFALTALLLMKPTAFFRAVLRLRRFDRIIGVLMRSDPSLRRFSGDNRLRLARELLHPLRFSDRELRRLLAGTGLPADRQGRRSAAEKKEEDQLCTYLLDRFTEDTAIAAS